MRETQPTTFMVPAQDYQKIIEQLDERTLEQAFIGRWESREAFGLHLLADTSAAARLAELPIWLRSYVKLDGEALTSELEAEGVYLLTPVESGVCVFDAAAVRPRAGRSQP